MVSARYRALAKFYRKATRSQDAQAKLRPDLEKSYYILLMQTHGNLEVPYDWTQLGYCWIGGARYGNPLNATDSKKWQALKSLGIGMYAIGFSTDLVPRHFFQSALFYTLPQLPIALLRHLTIFLITPFLLTWIMWKHNLHVILTHSPYEGAVAVFVKQLLQLFRKRIIVIIGSHGDWQEALFMYRRMYFVGFYRWIMRCVANYSLRNADMFRVISNSTRNLIQAWATNKPIFQFMSFTDVDSFVSGDREIPLAEAQDVLYAGSLVPLKGVDILLEAFSSILSRFPDARLWIVGSVQNASYVQQLKVKAQELRIVKQLIWTGAMSQMELAKYMRRTRVVVLPSYSEGLGKVLLEGMLCGAPVIGSHVGGIPDLIQNGVNGYLVPPGDSAALTKALLEIFEDQNIEVMGKRAREFALKFFSPELYIANHREMFEKACELWQSK